jgi:hypothetical protein
MATYLELRDVFENTELLKKVMVAVAIAAETVSSGADTTDPPWDQTAGAHDNRIRWAANAITDTKGEAARIMKMVIAANKDLTVSQINGASDTAIQANVDAAVDTVAAALFTGA